VTRTGDVPMPHPGEPRVGGHSLLCVGYDDAWRRFFFLNHWWNRAEARWWGNQGFGTIPYDYMLNRELTGDIYTLGRIVTA
jgi:C1A family cysteine protease